MGGLVGTGSRNDQFHLHVRSTESDARKMGLDVEGLYLPTNIAVYHIIINPPSFPSKKTNRYKELCWVCGFVLGVCIACWISWGKLVSLKFHTICWLDLFKKQDMGGGLRQYHWKVSNIYYLGFLPSSLWPPLKGSFFKIFRQLAWASSVNAVMIICTSCRDDHPTLHMSFIHESFFHPSHSQNNGMTISHK